MHRKILICAMILVAVVCTGCGEDKVVGKLDKSVLAYVELAMTGESANMSEAGFVESDIKKIRNLMTQEFTKPFNEIVPLSAESAKELTKIFHATCKAKMKFQAKVKTAEGDPVVELKTTPLDIDVAIKAANDDLIALAGMVGKLKSDGATEEQLRNNPDVQKVAVAALGKYLEAISVKEETTMEIKCVKTEGSDGKVHWAPANFEEIIKLIAGEK